MQIIGTLVLNGNPTNFFAEAEQVAFCTGHVVPGIEFTNDPLLQGRNFSYLDTQLTRLGGPNFTQIPINRPHAPVNDNHRDGFHQTAVHEGRRPYKPNSLDGDSPAVATGPRRLRERAAAGGAARWSAAPPASFDDHFSQAGDVLRQPDQRREAARRRRVHLRARQVLRAGDQGARPGRAGEDRRRPVRPGRRGAGPARAEAGRAGEAALESPALRQIKPTPFPIAGRIVGVVAGPGADLAGIADAAEGARGRGRAAAGHRAARRAAGRGRKAEIVERTFATARSIEFDAVVVADGAPKDGDFRVVVLLQEAFRHLKAVGAWGDGVEVLGDARDRAGCPACSPARRPTPSWPPELVAALGLHRAWDRIPLVSASMVPPTVTA